MACRRARAGDPAAPARTQASLAVSLDGEHWALINASPDLREQIGRSEFLHPRQGLPPPGEQASKLAAMRVENAPAGTGAEGAIELRSTTSTPP